MMIDRDEKLLRPEKAANHPLNRIYLVERHSRVEIKNDPAFQPQHTPAGYVQSLRHCKTQQVFHSFDPSQMNHQAIPE